MVSSIVWAVVALVFIGVVNYRFGQWMQAKKPLGQAQYEELKKVIEDLQGQVSSLSIQRGFHEN